MLGWQQPATSSAMEKRAAKTLGCTILGYTNREQERGAQVDFTLEVCGREVTVNIPFQFPELQGVFSSVWDSCGCAAQPVSPHQLGSWRRFRCVE